MKKIFKMIATRNAIQIVISITIISLLLVFSSNIIDIGQQIQYYASNYSWDAGKIIIVDSNWSTTCYFYVYNIVTFFLLFLYVFISSITIAADKQDLPEKIEGHVPNVWALAFAAIILMPLFICFISGIITEDDSSYLRYFLAHNATFITIFAVQLTILMFYTTIWGALDRTKIATIITFYLVISMMSFFGGLYSTGLLDMYATWVWFAISFSPIGLFFEWSWLERRLEKPLSMLSAFLGEEDVDMRPLQDTLYKILSYWKVFGPVLIFTTLISLALLVINIGNLSQYDINGLKYANVVAISLAVIMSVLIITLGGDSIDRKLWAKKIS